MPSVENSGRLVETSLVPPPPPPGSPGEEPRESPWNVLRTQQGPSTMLRMVPIPCKSRGGIGYRGFLNR
jgi:hypothetical protein